MSFDCVTLREGDWTYSNIALNGTINYTEDSTSGNITFYEYDKNGHVLKETAKDKQYKSFISTYEYNKHGALIRSTDHNGLCKETVYDEQGRTLKSMTYNIADPTSKFYSENVRDEKGKVLADVDITGKFNSAEYGFDHKDAVNVITDANGGKTSYGYHNDAMVSVSGDCDGEENKNTFTQTLGYTTRISSGNTNYDYAYDGWGRQKTISIAGEEYSSADYVNDNTVTVRLGNGESFTEVAAEEHDVAEVITHSDGMSYSCKASRSYYAAADDIAIEQTVDYADEELGLLRLSIDKSCEKVYTAEYKYDSEGRLINKTETGKGMIEQTTEYDAKGGVTNASYKINGVEQRYGYEYENAVDDRQIKITLPGGTKQELEYDGLGRVTAVNTKTDKAEYSKEIYYAKYGDHATKFVSTVWYGVNGIRNNNVKYGYDKNGNITSISENGKEVARYTYDSLNRLVREDNATYKEKINGQIVTGKTETYEYDNNGNIWSKTKYPYSRKTTLEGGEKTEYKYKLSGWCDQLQCIGNEDINAYDKLGNPWIYRNNVCQWAKGRNLITLGNEKYKYNAAGIRTGKTIGDVETVYYLDGNKIIAEERKNKLTGEVIDTLYYQYGTEGIAGFEYCKAGQTNGSRYIFRKSVNGDVTHIYNSDGKAIAKYIYDAWGNHSTEVAAGYEEVAERNPFRYRGYYFDVSTKLYYLNSRYYDAEVGRFINADDVSVLSATQELINGLNLYVYCLNDPVNAIDNCGRMPDWLAWLLTGITLIGLATLTVLTLGTAAPITGTAALMVVGATAGAYIGTAVSVVSQGIKYGWENISGTQVFRDCLGSAVAGAISAIPTGGGILGYIGSFGLGGVATVSGGLISGTVTDLKSAALAFVIGGTASVIAKGANDLKLNGHAKSIFNQGNKAKSLSVQNLQSSPFNMGVAALKGNMRNAFKNTSLETIKTLVSNSSPWIRLGIFSSLSSSFLSSIPYGFI